MFYVIALFFILLCITIINYYINDKIYISPAVVFSGVFTFSSLWLIFYAKKWNVELNLNTIIVIILGNINFSIICKIVILYFNKKNKKNYKEKQEVNLFELDNKKVNLFIVFCIIVNLLTLYYTVKSVDGSFQNIGNALYKYRNLTAYKGENVNIPKIIDVLSGVMHASSYWFMYVFINNFIKTGKFNIKILIVIILSIISSVFDGSRGALINNILAIIPLYSILKNKSTGFENRLKFKSIFILTLIAVMLLSTLKWTATLLGRNDISEINTFDYVAMYSGTQIKNLDTYLKEKNSIETYIGIHTFRSLYEIISNFFNTSWEMDIIATYRNENGYNLGNVYTIFFDFICDLGYFGLVFFTTIMALVSQIIFEKCKKVQLNKKYPNIIIIIYAYIFGGIVFAFFGNKFFPQVFSVGFLKYICLWYLYNWFFCKLKIIY